MAAIYPSQEKRIRRTVNRGAVDDRLPSRIFEHLPTVLYGVAAVIAATAALVRALARFPI
jgi:hypothetical protein